MRLAGGLLGLCTGGYVFYAANLLAPLRLGLKTTDSDLVEIEYHGRGGLRSVPILHKFFTLSGIKGGEPPQTYFGGIFQECNSRWWLHKSLFRAEELPAGQQSTRQEVATLKGQVELDARVSAEEDVYGLVDSLMGTTVIMSIRTGGPSSGAATAYLEVDWLGPIVTGQRYKLSSECTNYKGKDYFPSAVLTDKHGNVVRRYRSRFVRVDWPLAINIETATNRNRLWV